MSFMTQQASRALEIAENSKEKGVYLIAGGMHSTNSLQETLQYFYLVFIGEGEITLPKFMGIILKTSH